ncbi:MAG: RDD family protein [Dehalococcoidia bacterium]|nr:RDD family protein [Dehalococcoidia bacterium]MSQ17237.1 RDD family protein [Dehalococcoidia bacterium]
MPANVPENPQGGVFCLNCGVNTPSGGNFCPQCGFRLAHREISAATSAEAQPVATPAPASHSELPCSACGRLNPRFAPECGGCGSSLTSGVALPPPVAGFSSLEMALVGEEYMGFWIRVAASLIDLVISVAAIAGLLLFLDGGGPVLVYFLATGHNVVFVGLRGQTVGKMILGLQVVDRQGKPPSFWRILLRELGGKTVSGAFFLGYLWVGWHREKRGWHDSIAGTYVVRKHKRPTAS